jgi:LacI family transcriptional regulator
VSPALVDRVRQAVDELGFRPNVGASVLRRADARTASIGLLLDDVADPFSRRVLRAVQDAAAGAGVAVLSASVDGDPERERSLAAAFAARRADGLILVPAGPTSPTSPPRWRRVPRWSASAACRAASTSTPWWRPTRPARRRAVRHLAAPATPGSPSSATGDGRRAARRLPDRLEAAGLVPDPALVVRRPRRRRARRAGRDGAVPHADPPTALFTARAAVTVAALRTLHRLGLQRLVAVVGSATS